MARKIFEKDPEKFIPALAEALKNVPEFEVPEWAMFVKSGVSRERPPIDDDFWYVRAASILRQLYIKGVVGVGRLRTRYGSRKDRGGRACKFRKASGKIIRVILQQAETAGLVEKIDKMQYGRRLTQAGRDLLDSVETPVKVMIDSSEWTVVSPISNIGIQNSDGELDIVDVNKEEVSDGEQESEGAE